MPGMREKNAGVYRDGRVLFVIADEKIRGNDEKRAMFCELKTMGCKAGRGICVLCRNAGEIRCLSGTGRGQEEHLLCAAGLSGGGPSGGGYPGQPETIC